MKTKIKRRKVRETTNNITKAIVLFLLHRGHSASRVNVQGQYDPKLQRWRPSGSRKGFFDIACCIKDKKGRGRFVSIDVKKGKDKLSEDQKNFIKEVEGAGGVAVTVDSWKAFVDFYDGLKVLMNKKTKTKNN